MLNTLSDFFEVDVSELLNGEKGIKDKANVEVSIKEAIEKYKNIEEKRKNKLNKIKKVVGIFSLIVFFSSALLQLGYILIWKRTTRIWDRWQYKKAMTNKWYMRINISW